MAKTKRDYEGTYTDPELRERLKEEIRAADRGGRKGQWSARKAQLLTQEYEKAGGGYRTGGKRTGEQEHLKKWSDQDWHTKGGGAQARGEQETARYLPDVAWKLLTRAEREATDRRKRKDDQQHVANTQAAQEARRAAELLHLGAGDARKEVTGMGSASQLHRARKAEESFGKARKTVLEAIDRRLEQVS